MSAIIPTAVTSNTSVEGFDALVSQFKSVIATEVVRVRFEEAKAEEQFAMAVDHCFAIKGQGTVLTGTVLSGSISIGEVVSLILFLRAHAYARCRVLKSLPFRLFVR